MNTALLQYQLNTSIAWFRLHEACLKSEHERAFLNYKLLIHSYENKGFQKQILGHLHTLFNEKELANKSFIDAFLYYLQEKDYIAAVLIYVEMKKYEYTYPAELSMLLDYIDQNKEKFLLFDIF